MGIIVVSGILLALARLLELKQNVCCAKSPMSGLPSVIVIVDMRINSTIEISEVIGQLLE